MADPISRRRDFLRLAAAGAASLGAIGRGACEPSAQPPATAAGPPQPPAPRVDRRTLGRTGAAVSILGLGLGSAFVHPHRGDPETAERLLEAALERGINLWDTARAYGPSETLLRPVVRRRRAQIFLVSKSPDRTFDGFRRDLETSLRNLGTDRLDLYHIHDLQPRRDTDLDAIERGAVRAARAARDEGLIRHVGVTGHSGAAILVRAVRRWAPDVVLATFPCTRPDGGRYEEELLPLARERNVGLLAMKTVRHARGADLRGTDLVRYALSLEGVAAAVVGLDSEAHLAENAAMATGFEPLPAKDRAAMHRDAADALAGMPEPWLRPGYADACPA